VYLLLEIRRPSTSSPGASKTYSQDLIRIPEIMGGRSKVLRGFDDNLECASECSVNISLKARYRANRLGGVVNNDFPRS